MMNKIILMLALFAFNIFAQQFRYGNGRGEGIEWSGLFVQGIASDTFAVGAIVYLESSTGKFHLADSDVDSTQVSFLCYNLKSTIADYPGNFLYMGFVIDTAQTFTAGDSIYLSSDPGDHAPSGTKRLGYVKDTVTIFYDANEFRVSGGGGSFLSLDDTPDSYSGQGNKFVKVNAGETALEFATLAGGGDMLASTYDPTNVADDVFDVDNHNDGTTNKVFTATEKTKLAGIETGATKYPDTGEEVYSSAEKTKLSGIATGAEVNVNADWNSGSGDSQILNKPTIPDDADLLHYSVGNEFDPLTQKDTPVNDDVFLVENSEDDYNKVKVRMNRLPYQAPLVSGSNIKTINGSSILGSGDLTVSGSFPRGHIWGLTLSNNGSDANNDIDIAVGEACDGDATGDMVLAGALTKRLDATWAVGTNQGGLNTGAEANSTWYEVHLIKRTDTGVVDVMFTTTANRATLPANYSLSRRIGWIFNDGSGNIKAFSQTANHFTWITQVNDVGTTVTETATAITLTAPPFCIALFRAAAVSTTSVNEEAVIVFSERIEGNVTPASTTGIASLGLSDQSLTVAGHFQLRVDASRQIEHDSDNAVATFDISTYGFIDDRCQYGDY